MSASAKRKHLIRLILYYIVAVAAAVILIRIFPSVQEALTLDRLRELTDSQSAAELTETPSGTRFGRSASLDWSGTAIVPALVSMLGALVLMVPTARTYMFIKRKSGYDESVVHALIILPVAVTGIIMIVQQTLALAFSLAGVVAAVRFRTTLKDTKDAVYIFLAIGVGVAAGAGGLGIAFVLTLVFNAVNMTLYFTGFGNIYRDQLALGEPMGLGAVLAGPESGKSTVKFGDPQLMQALSDPELADVAHRVARMERYLDAESEEDRDRKQFHILLVHAAQVAAAQQITEDHLKENAMRWRLAEIIQGQGEVSILEYLVRLHDHCSPGGLLDLLRAHGEDQILAAEIRSLKGLKKKR